MDNTNGSLDYKDVYILPQYSEVTSRSLVDTSLSLKLAFNLDVPVISANMDTVTDGDMAVAMNLNGALGAIHRFMSIEQNVKEYQKVSSLGLRALVSIGVNEESKERAEALYEASAREFVIDIAHGHSKMMKDMISWFRERFGNNPFLVAGNVATVDGATDLFRWGADCVKIGIGPGNVCSTKNVTGVTVPQFSAVQELCAKEHKKRYETCIWHRTRTHNLRPLLIADGGITEIGDIAKALGAGADLVMCGRLFAACKEAPGPRINGKKIYRGMASRDAMLTIRDEQSLPAPEGISTVLDESGETAASVVKNIKGGLQSSFSYSNSRTLEEFQKKVRFGLRRTQAR